MYILTDLDLLHFEQLKSEIQSKYLENHSPSNDDISKWKGIDIIYFQEDLRKFAKGNISEKSFYTYFKNTPATKLPRIDILNILSIYCGYVSWYDFKKNHLFTDEILQELEELNDSKVENLEKLVLKSEFEKANSEKKQQAIIEKNNDLQYIYTENHKFEQNLNKEEITILQGNNEQKTKIKFFKVYLWLGVSILLTLLVLFLVFKDRLLSKQFTYTFIDADRKSKINDPLQIKIIKEQESPILLKVKPNESFTYTTKNEKLMMEVSSPYYKTDTIIRNLTNAPESETIELKPNDYAIMLFYYSNSQQDIKRKREKLNYLISEDALIYQVYDNDKYGVETIDKQKYINLVTTPTTSLKNLEVIDTQMNKGKIINIKFRIVNNENP